jgi:hypothetical protein
VNPMIAAPSAREGKFRTVGCCGIRERVGRTAQARHDAHG